MKRQMQETWQEGAFGAELMLLLPEKTRDHGGEEASRQESADLWAWSFVPLARIVSLLLIEWCLEAKNLRYLVFLKAVWLGCRVLC